MRLFGPPAGTYGEPQVTLHLDWTAFGLQRRPENDVIEEDEEMRADSPLLTPREVGMRSFLPWMAVGYS